MNRRKFLRDNLYAATAISVLGNDVVGAQDRDRTPQKPNSSVPRTGSTLTAREVRDYLIAQGREWINPTNTVDTFKSGDPNAVVRAIAVGWMSYFDSLRKARDMGCNLFVTHEPTYYGHLDNEDDLADWEVARKKKAFVEESGMIILRCHDVWDRVPAIGIRDAWASFLGLERELEVRRTTDRAKGRPYCGVYEIAPMPAAEFARTVAGKLAPLGESAVMFLGPGDKIVRSVAVGTGAITPFRQMAGELHADLAVCTDDGFNFWRDGSLALDMEYPVVVVSHSNSEEIGMRKLAAQLAGKFAQVPVHHIAQGCRYRWISGPQAAS